MHLTDMLGPQQLLKWVLRKRAEYRYFRVRKSLTWLFGNSSQLGINGFETMPDFQEFADFRHRLQEFCASHVLSLEDFKSDPSFKLHVGDTLGTELRHLTTTSTCIQSLLDCPLSERPNYA